MAGTRGAFLTLWLSQCQIKTNTEDVARKGEKGSSPLWEEGMALEDQGSGPRPPAQLGRPCAVRVHWGSARLTVFRLCARRTGRGWPRCPPQPQTLSVLPAATQAQRPWPPQAHLGPARLGRGRCKALDAQDDHLALEDVPANRPVPKRGVRTLGCPAPSAGTAAAGQPSPWDSRLSQKPAAAVYVYKHDVKT